MAGKEVFNIEGKFQVLDTDNPNIWLVNAEGKEIGQVRRQGRGILVLVAPALYHGLSQDEQIKFGQFVDHIRD
jgi:hypothetical protein